jgi:hypothetical protein
LLPLFSLAQEPSSSQETTLTELLYPDLINQAYYPIALVYEPQSRAYLAALGGRREWNYNEVRLVNPRLSSQEIYHYRPPEIMKEHTRVFLDHDHQGGIFIGMTTLELSRPRGSEVRLQYRGDGSPGNWELVLSSSQNERLLDVLWPSEEEPQGLALIHSGGLPQTLSLVSFSREGKVITTTAMENQGQFSYGQLSRRGPGAQILIHWRDQGLDVLQHSAWDPETGIRVLANKAVFFSSRRADQSQELLAQKALDPLLVSLRGHAPDSISPYAFLWHRRVDGGHSLVFPSGPSWKPWVRMNFDQDFNLVSAALPDSKAYGESFQILPQEGGHYLIYLVKEDRKVDLVIEEYNTQGIQQEAWSYPLEGDFPKQQSVLDHQGLIKTFLLYRQERENHLQFIQWDQEMSPPGEVP